jgi:hypothetical protein
MRVCQVAKSCCSPDSWILSSVLRFQSPRPRRLCPCGEARAPRVSTFSRLGGFPGSIQRCSVVLDSIPAGVVGQSPSTTRPLPGWLGARHRRLAQPDTCLASTTAGMGAARDPAIPPSTSFKGQLRVLQASPSIGMSLDVRRSVTVLSPFCHLSFGAGCPRPVLDDAHAD